MNKASFNVLNICDLQRFMTKHKQPSFRVNQVFEWVYGKEVDDFSLMTNLPNELISILSETFVITAPKLYAGQASNDGTQKFILEYESGIKNQKPICVECVAIPSLDKNSNQLTVCISSQAGCPMACEFCATGKQGFVRNLYCGEIIQQVLFIQKELNKKVSNIVVMGQGEPFLNFDNTIDALKLINQKKIIGIGSRKITLSTCGIVPGINKFTNIDKQFGLAISLHSAIQEKRNSLMPGVKNYTLAQLKNAIVNYSKKTNRRPTFEYLLIKGINDTEEDLKALINYCKGMLCHINLINLNTVPYSKLQPSSRQTSRHWAEKLKSYSIETTIRNSRGADIDAACGQLLNNLN